MFEPIQQKTKSLFNRYRKKELPPQDKKWMYLANTLPTSRMKKVLENDVERYRQASPFPNIVIDNFLKSKLLLWMIEEFVGVKTKSWRPSRGNYEEKRSIEKEARLGPVTRKVIHDLNSGTFISFLEKLTGIDGLISDPHLRGGGIHETCRGGKLGIHTDFNFYPRLKLYRRLNLLVYLNKDWQESWGGQLELWNRELTKREAKIAPIFNRAVLFDTSNYSFHGHPDPLNCPESESRKSLALYYYTRDYPYKEDIEPHSTLFRQPKREE